MSTRTTRAGGFETAEERELVRVDAALRQTVALLELVGQEEALLARLADCVSQLRAVQRARAHLLDVTDAEFAEAHELATHVEDGHRVSASSGEVGS